MRSEHEYRPSCANDCQITLLFRFTLTRTIKFQQTSFTVSWYDTKRILLFKGFRLDIEKTTEDDTVSTS